jgi:hypothetical protein
MMRFWKNAQESVVCEVNSFLARGLKALYGRTVDPQSTEYLQTVLTAQTTAEHPQTADDRLCLSPPPNHFTAMAEKESILEECRSMESEHISCQKFEGTLWTPQSTEYLQTAQTTQYPQTTQHPQIEESPAFYSSQCEA